MIKKYSFFIFFILIINTSLTFSQDGMAKIFCINLLNEKIDLKFGENTNLVLKAESLQPFFATKMIKTDKIGKHQIFYKKVGDENYKFVSDDEEHPNYYNIKSNKIHCIFVTTNGQINYFTIEDDQKTGAKICFVNGTSSLISKMQISKYWDNKIATYAENINVNAITNFVTIYSGIYSLFWQLPYQGNNEYLTVKKDNNKSQLVYPFRNDNYYLFIAYTNNKNNNAKLIVITP